MPSEPDQAGERSCGAVRRYLTEALFGGDEQALRETVAEPVLQERAWLFWAAFTDRALDDVEVLFANADGTRVACHFIGNMIQVAPWLTAGTDADGRPTRVECTGTYVLHDGKIVNFRETWR
jgi:hypothetical protein